MTIDERIEKLTERHEALSQSVEILNHTVETISQSVDNLNHILRENSERTDAKILALLTPRWPALMAPRDAAQAVHFEAGWSIRYPAQLLRRDLSFPPAGQ